MLISRIHMSQNKKEPQVATKPSHSKPPKQKRLRDTQRYINLKDPKDEKTFREHCEALWQELYEVDTQERNHPFYHSCCNCFSKRVFGMGDHGHPSKQTHRFIDWIDMCEISDAKGFHDHLVEKATRNSPVLQVLPGVNIRHTTDNPMDNMLIDIQERLSHLEKRNAQLETELKDSKGELAATQQKVTELEKQLQKEMEERRFAELVNQVNRQLEKQQTSKVLFEYDAKPTKPIKKWQS